MSTTNLPTAVYCDGGVIGPNPSKKGGTWAWCWVRGGEIVRHDSGVVTPEEVGLPAVTNNVTELLAAVRALRSVGKGWAGVLYTDSLVTLRRVTTSHKFKGVPDFLREEVIFLRRDSHYIVQLVGGHPTRKELREGWRGRNGLPVSAFNAWCDRACTNRAREHLERGRT